MHKIYLDYNASTPISPEVANAMKPFLSDYYGNPSSSHWAGAPAKNAFENARSQVATLLGCQVNEIVFTSGGSEANNYAIKGVFYALQGRGNHIITSQIEHPAVSNPCEFLRKQGATVSYVGVDAAGRVSPEEIERLITDKTILISIMHANNETGVIQPIREISKIARKYNIVFHTDAAQSAGKIDTKVTDLGVDLLSIAGHKLYAPKGIGALYVRQGTPLEPLIHGAGHEAGRRAGTENIILAVGLGKACELALKNINHSNVKELRDYFWFKLKQHFKDNVVLNGHPEERLPNTLNVSFTGMVGQDILSNIPELAASTGSACHAGMVELSPVLKAMKIDEHVGMGTIRFSLGKYTTKDELDQVFNWLADSIKN